MILTPCRAQKEPPDHAAQRHQGAGSGCHRRHVFKLATDQWGQQARCNIIALRIITLTCVSSNASHYACFPEVLCHRVRQLQCTHSPYLQRIHFWMHSQACMSNSHVSDSTSSIRSVYVQAWTWVMSAAQLLISTVSARRQHNRSSQNMSGMTAESLQTASSSERHSRASCSLRKKTHCCMLLQSRQAKPLQLLCRAKRATRRRQQGLQGRLMLILPHRKGQPARQVQVVCDSMWAQCKT